jgi:hypothetical protein
MVKGLLIAIFLLFPNTYIYVFVCVLFFFFLNQLHFNGKSMFLKLNIACTFWEAES